MILDALVRLYEQLESEGKVPPIGQSKTSVMFAIDIDEDGTFLQLTPLYETNKIMGKNKKEKELYVPMPIWVPEQEVRTSGIFPYLLCDKPKYLLGLDYIKKTDTVEFAEACFTASGSAHEKALCNVHSKFADAIISYFKKNNFEKIQNVVSETGNLDKIKWDQCLYVFRMDDVLATQDPAIMRTCIRSGDSSDAKRGICLVTGKEDVLTDKHFSIKGIGDKPNEFFTSFNNSAFCSYGLDGNENAPIGKYAASAYAIALSYLLSDRKHRINVGDTAVVCWADKNSEAYQDVSVSIFDDVFGDSKIPDDELCAIVRNLAAGRQVQLNDTELEANTGFYIMGIEANASRLSLKFYYEDTFGHLMQNVTSHWDAMKICEPAFDHRIPSVQAIVTETSNPDEKEKLLKRIKGDLFYSVLFAQPYPELLQSKLQERILAKRAISYVGAAALKAFYLRSPYTIGDKTALTEEVNEYSQYMPYVLGRLFALYVKIEEDARGSISIIDSYLRNACQMPVLVFPLLAEKAIINQQLIRRRDEKIYYCNEKELGNIMKLLIRNGKEIPAAMNMTQQGYFLIGYYQENQRRYRKKEDRTHVSIVYENDNSSENKFMDAGRLLHIIEELQRAVQGETGLSTKEYITLMLESPSIAKQHIKINADAYIRQLKNKDYGRAVYFSNKIQTYLDHEYKSYFTNKEKSLIILGYYAEKEKGKRNGTD